MKTPKQYDLGKGIGAYWTQLQFASGYMVFINFTMLAATLWATTSVTITSIVSWLNFPMFLAIMLVVLFVLLPVFDYVFVQRSRVNYQNSQGRLEAKIDKLQRDMDELKDALGR